MILLWVLTTIKNSTLPLLHRPMNKQVSIIIILFLLSLHASAQKGIELGGWLGVANYFGDLKTSLNFGQSRPAGGLNFRYNFDERISFKSSVNYARIHADDANSDNSYEFNRQLSFYSDIFEWSNQLEFNFFPYIHGSNDENWTPYLFGGISTLTFTPKRDLNGQTYNLRLYGTEGQPIGEEYGKWTIAGLIGFGIKWDINYDWSINVEAGLRVSSSDYIDDVSNVYPDFTQLRQDRGQTAAILSDPTQNIQNQFRQRGNNKNNDSYVLFGVSVMRYFGRLYCPKISQSK